MAPRGCPDIVGLFPLFTKCPGKFLGIEMKASDGVQSQDQVKFERWITECQGVYMVIRSLPELMTKLEQYL